MSKIIVYEQGSQAEGSFGNGVVKDWLSLKIKRNGTQYELEGVYRADGTNAHLLRRGNIIQCDADARSKKQRFDIIRAVEIDNERIEVYGTHVAHRLKYLSLLPNVTVEGAGYQAIDTWLSSIVGLQKFQAWSDVTDKAKVEWSLDKISNARAALYGHELSLATVWKADVGFDNYRIMLSRRLGKPTALVLNYGKNITEFRKEDTDEDVFTSVYPYIVREKTIYTLDDPERVIDSPQANSYPFSRVLPVDFSSEFKEDEYDGGNAGEDSAEGVGEGETESRDGESGGVWKRNSTGWWYEFADGSYLKNCWKYIDNEWYRFKKSGYIYQNAWFRDKHGNRYYFKDSGAMVTGWFKVKKKWKYFYDWGGLDKDRKKPYVLDKDKLRGLAQKYIRDHNIGLPRVTVTVKFVDLMADNRMNEDEDIAIYDEVKIRFPHLDNALSKAKIVGTEWLPLSNTYETITIGNEERTFKQTLTGHMEARIEKLDQELNEQASVIRDNENLLFNEDDGATVTYTAESLTDVSPQGFKKDDLLLTGDKLQRWTGTEWKDVEAKADVDVSHITMSVADIKTQMLVNQQEIAAKASLNEVSEWKRALDNYIAQQNKDTAEAEKNLLEVTRRVEQLVYNIGNMSVVYKMVDRNIHLTNEGITVGDKTGDSYILVSNNRISLFSSGKEVMYISQGMLHIDNGVFTKTLQVGNYIEMPLESNPKINVIRYVGGR